MWGIAEVVRDHFKEQMGAMGACGAQDPDSNYKLARQARLWVGQQGMSSHLL